MLGKGSTVSGLTTSGGFASCGWGKTRKAFKLWIIISNRTKNMKKNMRLAPVHPGDVLREDFLIPLGLSAYRVAKDLSVEPIAITSICKGETGPLLQDKSRNLDRSPGPVRPGDCFAKTFRQSATHPSLRGVGGLKFYRFNPSTSCIE